MKRSLLGVVAVVAVVGAVTGFGNAYADPASSTSPASDNTPEAMTRYIEGERHYAAGRYELAVAEFEAALALSQKPELHFNIANCYERAGNYAAAAESLGLFLNSGNAPEPEILRERIWRLERRAAEQEATISKQVEQRVASKLEAAPVAREIPFGPSPSKHPAYYTLAAGGALLATGIVFGSLSSLAGNNAEAECSRQLCTQQAAHSLRDERRYAQIADVTILAGVAAAGVGTYLWFRSSRKRESSNLSLLPSVDTQSVGVSAHARF